eukprot:7328123-Prymnesium_polylepis.1
MQWLSLDALALARSSGSAECVRLLQLGSGGMAWQLAQPQDRGGGGGGGPTCRAPCAAGSPLSARGGPPRSDGGRGVPSSVPDWGFGSPAHVASRVVPSAQRQSPEGSLRE